MNNESYEINHDLSINLKEKISERNQNMSNLQRKKECETLNVQIDLIEKEIARLSNFDFNWRYTREWTSKPETKSASKSKWKTCCFQANTEEEADPRKSLRDPRIEDLIKKQNISNQENQLADQQKAKIELNQRQSYLSNGSKEQSIIEVTYNDSEETLLHEKGVPGWLCIKIQKKITDAKIQLDLNKNPKWVLDTEYERGYKTWIIDDDKWEIVRGEILADFRMEEIVSVLLDTKQRVNYDKSINEAFVVREYNVYTKLIGTVIPISWPFSNRITSTYNFGYYSPQMNSEQEFVYISFDSDSFETKREDHIECSFECMAQVLTKVNHKQTKQVFYNKFNPQMEILPMSIIKLMHRNIAILPQNLLQYMETSKKRHTL